VEEQRLFFSNGRELAGEVELKEAAEQAGQLPDHSQVIECHAEGQANGTKALLLVRSVSDPRITNLGSFRSTQTFPALPSGEFKMVRKLSTGINGDIFQYTRLLGTGSESVAVKMLQNNRLARIWGTETDERTIHTDFVRKAPPYEDALTEIGILSYLSQLEDLPESLLKMRAVFLEGDFTWLVTELCDGGELFDLAASGVVSEPQIRIYSRSLFEAVTYLHAHHIAHRDISLENVLLKNGQVKLMDFGMAVRSHSTSGAPLRYFRAVGKDFYRAPECYVPRAADVSVTVPDGAKSGEVIFAQTMYKGDRYLCEVCLPADFTPGQTCACRAEVWGYTGEPADMWALGICVFILGFQCPPWNWAMLDDSAFGYVYTLDESSEGTGLEAVLKNWGKSLLSPDAMALLKALLTADPSKRPTAKQCLETAFCEGSGDTAETIAYDLPGAADKGLHNISMVGGA
jgi:serine/threonine protein kinase